MYSYQNVLTCMPYKHIFDVIYNNRNLYTKVFKSSSVYFFWNILNISLIYCSQNSQDFSVIKHTMLDFSRKDCSFHHILIWRCRIFTVFRSVHGSLYILTESRDEIVNWSFSIEVQLNNILTSTSTELWMCSY